MNSARSGSKSGRGAFTLTELLVVIAIAGVLAGLILAVVGRMRAAAESAVCGSNLRQIHAACLLYAADNKNYLPNPEAKTKFSGPGVEVSWWAEILPYYTNRKAGSASLGQLTEAEALRCLTHARRIQDATGRVSRQNYGMNFALGYCTSPLNTQRRTLASLPSPARTIMITEGGYTDAVNIATLNATYLKASARFDGKYLGGAHGGANNVLWCDGHVSAWPDVDRLVAGGDASKGETSLYWTPGFSISSE